MDKASSKQKGAGRASSGNVTVDLGEVLEKKIRSAGLRRTEVAGAAPARGIGRPMGFRPGMYGGFRPWLGRFGGGRPWLGQEGSMTFPVRSLIPREIQAVKTASALGGLALGLAGNRALVRVTPMIVKNDSKLLHEGMAFLAGIIPLLLKRNATTVGVAIPGIVYFGGSLLDLGMDAIGVPPAALKGSEGAQRMDASAAARQRLAALQQRIQMPQQQPQQPAVRRVVAQAF